MKRLANTACVLALMAAGTANADCADELAALDPGSTTGMTGTEGSAGAEGEGIAKDGSLAPLEEPGGGGTSDTTAMSGADAASQQAGGLTAAGEAEADGSLSTDTDAATSADGTMSAGTTMPATREEALEQARAALARGDEAACLQAVEHARTM